MSDDTFTNKVAAWAFGGAGILRHEGFAVFVPFSAPGDTIRCRIKKRKKKFAEGIIEEIISPAPTRTTPLCPVYGKCGGCQLQHVNAQEQQNYKHTIIKDAFQRIGKLKDITVDPVISAQTRWFYRRHITLNVFEGKVGFLSIDNESIIEPPYCAIFSDHPSLFSTLRILSEGVASARITLIKYESKFLLEWESDYPLNKEHIEQIQNTPLFAGGIFKFPKKTLKFGQTAGTISYENKSFHFEIGAFLQNHPEQSAAIYSALVTIAKESQAKNILDLYSGIGITTCLLAETAQHIDAVESNPTAVASAKINSKLCKLENCRHYQGPVEKILKSFNGKYDFAFINPPRIGMDTDAIRQLLRLRPQTIVYLSCMPSTLARDLQLLSEYYTIEKCTPYDMFPQTAHVETLVVLRLR